MTDGQEHRTAGESEENQRRAEMIPEWFRNGAEVEIRHHGGRETTRVEFNGVSVLIVWDASETNPTEVEFAAALALEESDRELGHDVTPTQIRADGGE